MYKKPIPVNEPLLDGNEKLYLNDCIKSGWISSDGPYVKRFEDKVAKVVGRKYGISVSNGSSALDLAIAVLDISKGDEVILPSHTIISCASAIYRSGATPVVVDCCEKTYNMTVDNIIPKITSRTKAIMVVHIYGITVDIDPIIQLAKKNNILIIEDAAEMMGQTYKDNPCGSFGQISTFSFYANKHVTTGEGGMVLTDDENLAEKCKYYRNLCFKDSHRFQHEHLGWNLRLTNLQAAVGLAQIEQLDKFIKIKKSIGARYNELLKDIDCFQLPVKKTDYCENIYWVYPIVINEKINVNAKDIQSMLNESGIGTRPFFWPIHLQKVFLSLGMFKDEKLPVSERISKKGFYIPSGMALTKIQQNTVTHKLKEVIKSIK